VTRPTGARTIDEVLATARAGLGRLSPGQASDAAAAGAVLVDIRPAAQRAEEGEIPGALIVERNVLEWRFDPACTARLPLASYDLQVVVFCSQGYTSSLAAAALQELGVYRATDLDGGFQAWAAAGLPVSRTGHSPNGSGCASSASASHAMRGGAAGGSVQVSRDHSSDS
jgi:rhodanese-related sulfurtransferase